MSKEAFDLVPTPHPRYNTSPFTLQDQTGISLSGNGLSSLMLDKAVRTERGKGTKTSSWVMITGSGHFPGIHKGGLSDLRNTPLLASVLQKYYFNFGIDFALDDVTDRDAIEDPKSLGHQNQILIGGVFANLFTAFLVRYWHGLLKPGFESSTSGTLHGIAPRNVFHAPDHSDYGLFSIVVNPWSTSPSICIILAGVGGLGTQAATRYFVDIVRNRTEPTNNKESQDNPGHILRARPVEYFITKEPRGGFGESGVVTLDSIKGWDLIE